jgi:hypothetical protein
MRRPFEMLAVAVLLMSQWVVPANASPILQLEQSGFAPLQIVDNQPGDSDPRIGFVQFSGSYGSTEFVRFSVRSEPTGGGGGLPELDLNGGFSSGLTGGRLTVWAADDNYNFGTTPAIAFGSAFGSSTFAFAAFTVQSWVNPANLIGLSPAPGVVPGGSAIVFGPPDLIIQRRGFPEFFCPDGCPLTDTVDVSLTGPFSMFHRVIVSNTTDVAGSFAVKHGRGPRS